MNQPSLEELLEAGAHFGHRTSKWHPKMKPYIYTERNTVHILDLQQTRDKIKEAQEFIADLIARGESVLLVGTKRQAKKIVKKTAKEVDLPYVTERWLGGTFTNFGSIKKQVKKLEELEAKRDSGALDKYTKKEQVDFDKEIDKLTRFFGGLRKMHKLPEAIFVVDFWDDKNAISEAHKRNVKIVGLCDTNADPSKVDYCIPCNDDSVQVLELVMKSIKEAILEGKARRDKKPADKKPAAPKK